MVNETIVLKEMIKNILVLRTDRFGEFLLNIPVLRALKELYPQALLTLAVNREVAELANCIEYADRVVVWDEIFRKQLRKQRFDISVVLNPTKEAHWAIFISGIPTRVGYDRKWGILLTHRMPDKKDLGLKHEVESNLELAGLIGAKTTDKSIYLRKLPECNNSVYAGSIAIHPYTSDKLKQWEFANFQLLAKKILDELGLRIVIVGRDESKDNSLGKGSQLVTDLVNKTSLVELAQVLKQCKILVTCDSGPMHLAASVGTPVIALFRNDLAGKTSKRWGPWGNGHIVISKSSLNDISVDEVFNRIKGLLYSPSAG